MVQEFNQGSQGATMCQGRCLIPRLLSRRTVLISFGLAAIISTICVIMACSGPVRHLPLDQSGYPIIPGSLHPVLTYAHKKLPSGEYVDAGAHSYRISVSREVVDKSFSSGVALSVHPALVGNGDWVTVQWKGRSAPSPRDWIGMYCPTDKPADEYVEYWLVRDIPTHREGYGSVAVRAYNFRVNCQFRYYGNESVTQLLATSNHLRFKGGRKVPLQGHLALTGDPTEMRVQWTSGIEYTTPVVHYGLSADRLDRTATGGSHTYTASDMCGSPANKSTLFIDPGFLHDVLVRGLLPSTSYYYQYGSDGAYSEVRTFTTSPALGSDLPVKIVTYGDMSASAAAEKTASLVEHEINNGVGLVLHQGDLSYAVGYSYLWDQWMHLIEPMAVRVPYMIAVGNHEQDHMDKSSKDPSNPEGTGFHPSWGNYGYDSGGECGVPTVSRFHMPENGNRAWWYSFNYGSIHFTVMSTEHDFTPGSAQYKWLENDIRSVNRNTTPWLILVAHRPLYSSQKFFADYVMSIHMRDCLEELLHQQGVDLMLCGHYHSYERTCPVYKERCLTKGTVHIVLGGAGVYIDYEEQYRVAWSQHFETSFGYGRLTANRTSLLWEYVRNVDQSVTDMIHLTR